MSERLSRERLEEIREAVDYAAHVDTHWRDEWTGEVHGWPRMCSDLLAHIAALEARTERLRAVRDVVGDFIRRGENRRTWRNLVKALAALDEEVGGE